MNTYSNSTGQSQHNIGQSQPKAGALEFYVPGPQHLKSPVFQRLEHQSFMYQDLNTRRVLCSRGQSTRVLCTRTSTLEEESCVPEAGTLEFYVPGPQHLKKSPVFQKLEHQSSMYQDLNTRRVLCSRSQNTRVLCTRTSILEESCVPEARTLEFYIPGPQHLKSSVFQRLERQSSQHLKSPVFQHQGSLHLNGPVSQGQNSRVLGSRFVDQKPRLLSVQAFDT